MSARFSNVSSPNPVDERGRPGPASTIVLCGAGVSLAEPSSVPSWWGFNQAVLGELRQRFLAEHRVPVRAANALSRLSLDDLDVAEFSQVVADAFAGDTWFDSLRALDGERPNINHHVLAELAKQGRLQVVLTTNFDTLIERAMQQIGVAVRVSDVFADSPPKIAGSADEVRVVKLHGTCSRHSTLVDLGSQKRRGLPTGWLDWLQTSFRGAEVLVVGFSGADLAMRPDYLRLEAAASEISSMRWLASSRPNEQVNELLRLGGTKFSLVPGYIPDAWTSLRVDQTVVDRARDRVDAPATASVEASRPPEIGAVIDQWLAHPLVDADTCGLALTRLLDAAGRKSAAQALRVSISTRVRRALRAGLPYSAVPRAALQIGQIAADEPPGRTTNALYCLDLASRAFDALMEHAAADMRTNQMVQQELAHNRANLIGNRAYVLLVSGDPTVLSQAASAAEEAWKVAADRLTGLRRDQHESSYWELRGAIELARGSLENARGCLLKADELSLRAGNLRRHRAVAKQLRRLES